MKGGGTLLEGSVKVWEKIWCTVDVTMNEKEAIFMVLYVESERWKIIQKKS